MSENSSHPAIHVTLEGTDFAYRLEPVVKNGTMHWPAPRGSSVWITKAEMRALSGVQIRAHFEGDPDSLEYGAMKHVRTRPRGAPGSKQVGTDGKPKPWSERTHGVVEIESSDGSYAQVKVTARVKEGAGEVWLTCVANSHQHRTVMTPAQRKKKDTERRAAASRETQRLREAKLRRQPVLSLGQTAKYIRRSYEETKKLARAGAFLGAKLDSFNYIGGRRIPLAVADKYGGVWHIPRASVDAWLAENGHGTYRLSKGPGAKKLITLECEACGVEWEQPLRRGPRPGKCDRCRFR